MIQRQYASEGPCPVLPQNCTRVCHRNVFAQVMGLSPKTRPALAAPGAETDGTISMMIGIHNSTSRPVGGAAPVMGGTSAVMGTGGGIGKMLGQFA